MPRRQRESTTLLPSASITAMPFEGPYQTPMRAWGSQGLNLRDPQDQLEDDQLSIATNVDQTASAKLTTRWGQQNIAQSGGSEVHSFKRMDDVLGNTATRVWGIDTSLFIGFDGGLSSIDSGYSGDPLHLVPLRPELSGQSWMYVGDRLRMRKVRNDGLNLPIGVSKAAKPTTALVAEERTEICSFDSTDSSDATVWDANKVPGDPSWQPFVFDVISPSIFDPFTEQEGTGAIGLTSIGPGIIPVPEDAPDPWFVTHIDRALDLSKVGTRDATDEDMIHFWIGVAKGSLVVELRIYFITTNAVVLGEVPGRNNLNENAFVKAIRPRDLVGAISVVGNQPDFRPTFESETPATADPDFMSRTAGERELNQDNTLTSPPPLIPVNLTLGNFQWKEFGVSQNPFRRGSFFKIGEPDWSNVTGIMLYVQSVGPQNGGGGVFLDHMYLHGGYGPDASEPDSIKYDIRVTDYDTRTGTEGNPSDEQDEDTEFLEPVRRGLEVTPVAKGDPAFRQRIYVRGGFNVVDWHRAGVNTADGAVFVVEENDVTLAAKDTLELDHDEPVTTVDTNGDPILAQPLPVIFPLGDLLVGLGDPNRPGHLYWCLNGEYGHWPPQNTDEVCPPSEELMGGRQYNGQGYVWSRQRLYIAYQNLTSPGSIITANTPCTRGLHSRWGHTEGERGLYAVDPDGIYRTTGGEPTEIADTLRPLFHREAANGYLPIDMSQSEAMRLRAAEGRVFFHYRDTGGTNHIAVFDERRDVWRAIWTFGQETATIEVEDHESSSIHLVRIYLGGRTSGNGYALSDAAFSDDGAAITVDVRSSWWSAGIQRENKEFGDAILDVDASLTEIVTTFRLDHETTVNASQSIPASEDGRRRYILDAFGRRPQFAVTLSMGVTWSSATRRPTLYEWGVSFIPCPEETNLRSTQWDDLGSANEKYLIGVMMEVDTFDQDRAFVPEIDFQGQIQVVTNVSPTNVVRADGRHRFFFSWPRVKANLVRIQPDDTCNPWRLFKLEWKADREPPRIALPDSNFEEHHDSYYTGLDLVLDTFGLEKRFELYVDGVLLVHPNTTEPFWRVTANGKQTVHLTTTPGYGHIFRWKAIDITNECLVYTHRWFLSPQPSEQTNLNQGYTVAGTRADKQIKGVAIEIDTNDVPKSISVEVDHVVHESFTVDTADRIVVQHAFVNGQVQGRVVRVFSTDAVPCRFWEPPQLIFDEEPLALKRWETQEITFGLDGWLIPCDAEICYRATAAVDLTVTTQVGDDGTTITDVYTAVLPSTAGVKQKRYLGGLNARKGVLVKLLFESVADVQIFREESELLVQEWANAEAIRTVKPFGNDDMDADREMRARLTPDSNVPATPQQEPAHPQAQ